MSPHVVLEPFVSKDSSDNLLSFQVSENAFLPSRSPINALPDAYYESWERLAIQLPTLLKNNTLRAEVSQLPVLSTHRLKNLPEFRRAYSILTFLTHGYIWGGNSPAEILPPCLSVPLLDVSAQLELPPVATYAALNLWNYRTASPEMSPRDLDGLSAQLTFTATVSESWFYMVSVAMEAEGGNGDMIPAVLRALQAIQAGDDDAYSVTITALEAITACIRRLAALLARMHENCDPSTFYYAIRPFLAGSLGMAKAGLPRGVFYDEGDGKGIWRQFRGGSNGQSSLIQFIDIALGVQHGAGEHSTPDVDLNRETGESTPKLQKKETTNFHEEVLDYMPGPHRRFLQAVRRMGSLRTFALHGGGSASILEEKQRQCHAAYVAAVDAMTEMRNGHLKIVTRYIVLPSQKPWTGPSESMNLASVSSKSANENSQELTGTGGTALMSFLRKARDDTKAATGVSA